MLTANHLPGRRSIRLAGRDYSWPDTYFCTLCTHQRRCLFGRVEHETMHESTLGRLVRESWLDIPRNFASATLDAFIVMPNHFHALLHLQRRVAPTEPQRKVASFSQPQLNSLGWLVRSFKAAVTRQARKSLHRPNLVVWQANYFERVVRNAKEHAAAYRYILENPQNWHSDQDNPHANL